MTSDDILKEIRRRFGDVDGILNSTNLDDSDAYLFEYIDSAVNSLTASEIVTETYTVSGTSISPEPSLLDGLLISTWVVSKYLDSNIQKKIRDGELGIRFRSGQDEISTIEAARQIGTAHDKAKAEFRYFVAIKLGEGDDAAARLQ